MSNWFEILEKAHRELQNPLYENLKVYIHHIEADLDMISWKLKKIEQSVQSMVKEIAAHAETTTKEKKE